MHVTRFLATAAALAQAPAAVLANPQNGRLTWGGPTGQQYPTPAPEVSDCTANVIATLEDYKKPVSGTAVASSGRANCWEYCNKNPPCNFVIFARGNPYTGSGSCWLYPGETFDKSLGKEGSDYLTVYDKPVCKGDPTKTTEGACAATASPSAVAAVCDYPTPEDNCFSTCHASGGPVSCLSKCAESDSCNYAIFKPRTANNSPYQDGTCWMYPNGTYDSTKAGTCSGAPELYVYNNPCPKPKPSSTSGASGPSASSAGSGSGGSGSAGSGDDASPTPTGAQLGGQGGQAEGQQVGGNQNGAASLAISVSGALGVGLAALLWQTFR